LGFWQHHDGLQLAVRLSSAVDLRGSKTEDAAILPSDKVIAFLAGQAANEYVLELFGGDGPSMAECCLPEGKDFFKILFRGIRSNIRHKYPRIESGWARRRLPGPIKKILGRSPTCPY
jgi:hypothetical protein